MIATIILLAQLDDNNGVPQMSCTSQTCCPRFLPQHSFRSTWVAYSDASLDGYGLVVFDGPHVQILGVRGRTFTRQFPTTLAFSKRKR